MLEGEGEGSNEIIRGSISHKKDLQIDIPDDKKADKNPDFKTP